jgi:hypothetical protein
VTTTRENQVAEAYARERGLEFHPEAVLRCPPDLPGSTRHCYAVLVGPVAGGRRGLLYVQRQGPPGAQFDIDGIERTLDGLCVHRSGTNLLTRQPLPKHYTELELDDAQFGNHFRVGVRSPDSADIARRLLDPTFTSWYVQYGPQGGVTSQAGTFFLAAGVLYLRGDRLSFTTIEALDTFARAAAGLADRVAAWAAAT